MKVLIVEPGKTPKPAEIENTFSAKQAIVGGMIETVSPPNHPDDAVLICNEEGKLLGLEMNRMICLADGTPFDIICGPFIICRAPTDSDEFEGLTDSQIEIYSKMYN